MTKKTTPKTAPLLRQGDVLMMPVAKLPQGCTEVPMDAGRIVLAYGEVTGHSHAITDHLKRESARADHHDTSSVWEATPEAAAEIAEAAIARAKLWKAKDGTRYLEVRETVHLRHEEHTAHEIPPGIYQLPSQVEYTPAELRRVAD